MYRATYSLHGLPSPAKDFFSNNGDSEDNHFIFSLSMPPPGDTTSPSTWFLFPNLTWWIRLLLLFTPTLLPPYSVLVGNSYFHSHSLLRFSAVTLLVEATRKGP
ncbi:hypothetical protein AAZX31_02G120500 [Glycine max]|nr:hypothetical protein GLYMA_02G127850v4 [Glycine max]KAH1060059.1 hypothetical protein GYH30_003849 [Glycine max]